MKEAINNFNTQFAYEPEIVNGERLVRPDCFVVAGMGGSHLAADLVKTWKPSANIIIHSDYWPLPLDDKRLGGSLVVASSYSGNTEETLDVFQKAHEKNLASAALSVGGKLLESAKTWKVPYIQLPDTGIQPRMATGFSFVSLLKLMGEKAALKEVSGLADSLKPAAYGAEGRLLAGRLKGFVPVIYSSRRNFAIAYNWKIKFNETGKIPAFANVFPELNHNEMTGFDVKEATKGLSRNFHFIILKDAADHPQIQKRMEVISRLYDDRGLPVETIEMRGKNIFEKMFSTLVLADWTAFYTADAYGVESEEVPMVEEFKKLI